MTAQQIVDRLILDNQNLVLEELMKHDDSIWERLENFDEESEVLEWWLVTRTWQKCSKTTGKSYSLAMTATGGADRHLDRHFTWAM